MLCLLTVPKDLDSAEKLVEIIRQAWLGVPLLSIGEKIDLGFLPLRLGGQMSVHVEEAISNDP